MKNQTIYLFSALAATVFLGGCAGVSEPEPQFNDLKAETILSHTAALSNTFIHDPQSKKIICTQPQPDAAFNQSEEGSVSISLISIGGGSESDSDRVSEGTTEGELAGRTPAILMARELFYRLCEFSRNQSLSKAEALKLYTQTLGTVKEVWATEAGNTTITVGDTVSTTTTDALTSTRSTTATDSNTTADTTSQTDTGSTDSSSTDTTSTDTDTTSE